MRLHDLRGPADLDIMRAAFAQHLARYPLTAGLVLTAALDGVSPAPSRAAVNDDFAFLVHEPISDLLAALVLIGSFVMRRPLVGRIALEISPRAMHGQDLRLRLFYWLTVAWLAYVLAMGGFRIFLLVQDLSPEAHILMTRAASWSVAAILLCTTTVRTARRVRERPLVLTALH